MDDLIDRQAVTQIVLEFIVEYLGGAFDEDLQKKLMERMNAMPSAQPEVTEEEVKEYCRKRCLCIVDSALLKKYASAQAYVPDTNVGDIISRQAAIDAIRAMQTYKLFAGDDLILVDQTGAQTELMMLPSAQPEIIRCKDCKHWTQSTGKMKGYGLGRCDFHDADLVTCNGFCYWAERQEE